jgi:uncharacterized surface protein with fasciclin (FAS1) repeats
LVAPPGGALLGAVLQLPDKQKPQIQIMIRNIRNIAIALTLSTPVLFAATYPVVGGKEMYPTKNIVQNAANSADHTTLVAAVKAAALVDTLEGKGPFTVFAPTNEAFEKLPAGTVDTLLKPENKDKLTKILTYHVIAGKLSAVKLAKEIQQGAGQATLKTVNGETLTAMMNGKMIVLKDHAGNTSNVTIADLNQSNGVIHVIDSVLIP